jgi:hypothetical protein
MLASDSPASCRSRIDGHSEREILPFSVFPIQQHPPSDDVTDKGEHALRLYIVPSNTITIPYPQRMRVCCPSRPARGRPI